MIRRALSLKQPWAALVVAGRKTIEVRRWRTAYRGELLIHAARVPDEREGASACRAADLEYPTRGLVGVVDLVDCVEYPGRAAFVADRERHLNDPEWYQESLVGFVFANARPLPFRAMPGFVRLFDVELEEVPPAPTPTPAPEPEGRFGRLMRSLGKRRE